MARSSETRVRSRMGVAAASLVCLALATPGAARAAITAQQVVPDAFNGPVHIAQAPNSDRRLFVVEKPGTFRVIKDGALLPAPFIDLTARVRDTGPEEGLLSVAFPPNYGSGKGSTTRRFYVFFDNNDGDLQIEELKRSTDSGDVADQSYTRNVLTIPHPTNVNHNGGQLQFRPSGRLFIGTGDGGSGNDPPNNAQNPDSLLGKLLRIVPLPSGAKPYTNPPGNPFAGPTPGRAEIYSLGLRNPWRFSFDGDELAIGDVGQEEWEEVDFLDRRDANGANFGWSGYEGFEVQIAERAETIDDHTEPVLAYPNPLLSAAAVVGGYVVRDPALTGLTGRYLYSDSYAGQLRSFDPDDPQGTDAALGVSIANPASFGVDNAKRVYVTSLGDGHVYRLAP